MKIPFYKMEAAGNDFVVVDNRMDTLKKLSRLATSVCRYKLGIGADGLLVLEKERGFDFRMRIFNPDGSEPDMCGNGARCLARYAYIKGVAGKKMSFLTGAGALKAEIRNGSVRLKLALSNSNIKKISLKISKKLVKGYLINTGVPHFVVFSRNLSRESVEELGRKIRFHPLFKPAGTNVDFVYPKDRHNINVRTYERGVEKETLACGTGAVASALVAAEEKRVSGPVKVRPTGGETLKVYFKKTKEGFEDVWLEGSAIVVFTGEMEI